MSAPNKNYDPVEVTALTAEEVERAVAAALSAISAARTLDELKEARIAHAGDRAPLSLARAEIGALPPQARADAGRRVGAAIARVKDALAARQDQLERERDEQVLITERVEVVPLGLDLGALGDLVAHRHEHVGELVGEHAHRVAGALRRAVVRQGDVDALGDQHLLVALTLKLLLALFQCIPDQGGRRADPAARVGTGLGRQGADLGAGQGER